MRLRLATLTAVTMSETPAERRLRCSKGGLTSWARTPDRSARAALGQEGLRGRFAREIDPAGTLPTAELETRVDLAMRAHFAGLAIKSSKARRARKGT